MLVVLLLNAKARAEGEVLTKKELDDCLVDIQNGDEVAFERLYNETKKPVFSFIYTYTNNYSTTEDLLQDTYIRLRQNVDKYKAGSNALAWIFTIAKNITLNEIKKDKRSVPFDFAERPDVLGGYEQEYDTPIMDAVKTCLDKDDQRIVLLHAVAGYKHKEIASIVDKPLGTVLWRYNKAIKKLKEYLIKEDK